MRDFNLWERRARELIDAGRLDDALRIYMTMADGDLSLDGGYLGQKIGECYERLGDLHAAKFWYGRAAEENPGIARYVEARARLEHVTIDDLLDPLPQEMPRRVG